MPQKPNLDNEKTNINFIWAYDFQRLRATEKIIRGEKIEMQDIIPNYEELIVKKNEECENISLKAIFFLQNVTSYALNFDENSVRLVVHPMYSYILNYGDLEEIEKIENFSLLYVDRSSGTLEERRAKIKELCEQRIQEKYNTNMTLKEIEEKYEECFRNFEKEIQKYNKNFSIVKFEDLVHEYMTEEEIENDNMVRFLVNEDCIYRNYHSLGSVIDVMRVSLNYYGLGYEKNFTLDMDNSPGTLTIYGELKEVRCQYGVLKKPDFKKIDRNNINDLGEIKFPNKFKMGSMNGIYQCDIENSLLYTKNSKNKILGEIKDSCGYGWKADDFHCEENVWAKTGDYIRKILAYNDHMKIFDPEKYEEARNLLIAYKEPEMYFLFRSFKKEDLISDKKVDLPLIYEKNSWLQDEFFKMVKKNGLSGYSDGNELQKILRDMYERKGVSFSYEESIEVSGDSRSVI